MDILNSDWLLAMLEKSSGKASQRLLNLFDILGDWLQAPHIREHLKRDNRSAVETPAALLQYLTEQSRILRAAAPETLAHQLYFIAVGALQQELRTPGCQAFLHARQAAQALVDTQKPAEHKPSLSRYGMAASLAAIAGLSSYLAFSLLQPTSATAMATLHTPTVAAHQTLALPATYANPVHTAEMYASIERMRGGVCHYFEALMLPEGQQGVYLRNVVGGEVSTDAADQAVAARLMQRVRCDYAPMLMKNSTS